MGTHPRVSTYRFIVKLCGVAENHLANNKRKPSFWRLFGFGIENQDSESGYVKGQKNTIV